MRRGSALNATFIWSFTETVNKIINLNKSSPIWSTATIEEIQRLIFRKEERMNKETTSVLNGLIDMIKVRDKKIETLESALRVERQTLFSVMQDKELLIKEARERE